MFAKGLPVRQDIKNEKRLNAQRLAGGYWCSYQNFWGEMFTHFCTELKILFLETHLRGSAEIYIEANNISL